MKYKNAITGRLLIIIWLIQMAIPFTPQQEINAVDSNIVVETTNTVVLGDISSGAGVGLPVMFVFALVALFSSNTYATVTYAIGASETYTTIQAAVTAIPSTISEPYVLEVYADYSTETGPITLGAKTGASSTNTITIRPEGSVISEIVISRAVTNSTSDAVFKLNGCKYYIIDGRPGGSGSNKYFTIRNTTTGSTNGPVIYMYGAATNNTIRYVNLENECSGGAGQIYMLAVTTNAVSNNTVTYCMFRDLTAGGTSLYPSVGIRSTGLSGYVNTADTVSYCDFKDIGSGRTDGRSIYIGDYNASWVITRNNIYQSADYVMAALTYYGISMATNVTGTFTISNNYFGGQSASCGGSRFNITASTGKFYFIYVSNATGVGVDIDSNTITNTGFTSSGAGDFISVYSFAGATNFRYNNIGDAVNGITETFNGTPGASLEIVNLKNTTASGIFVCTNNMIRKITQVYASAIGTATNRIISFESASTAPVFSNNTIQDIDISGGTSGSLTIKTVEQLTVNTSTGTIENNIIKNSQYSTASSAVLVVYYAMFLVSGSMNISKNYIYNLNNAGTNASNYLNILYPSYGTSAIYTITNNVINLNVSTANQTIVGLQVSNVVQTAYLYHNTIIISGTNTSGQNAGVLIQSGASTVTNKNNIIQVATTGTANYCVYYILGSTYVEDYNYLVVNTATGKNYGRRDITNYTSITSWETAISGLNDTGSATSLACDVEGRPTVTYAGINTGADLTATVPDDRDGKTRTVPVSMGAYEMSYVYISNSSNTWATTTMWTPTGLPGDSDIVQITTGHKVTVAANAACKTLSFIGTVDTLTVNTGCTLTVVGAMTLNNAAAANTQCLVTGAGTINCDYIQVGGTTTITGTPYTDSMFVSIPTINVTGDILLTASYNATPWYNNPRFLHSTGTIDVNGTIRTINPNASNSCVYNMNTGSKNGKLILSSTPFNIAALGTSTTTLNSASPWATTVVYDQSGGIQPVRGTTYDNLQISGSGTKSAEGNIVIDSTITTPSDGILDMMSAYTLSGALITITNNGTIKTSTPTTTSATPIAAGKSWGGTIEYAASSAQTVMGGSYNNITFSGVGTKTAVANISTTGNVLITEGAFNQGATFGLKTGGSLIVSSNSEWYNLGTGYDSLGGPVTNSGFIKIDGNDSGCGNGDGIFINSSSNGVRRNWSGAGEFKIYDVKIKDMSSTPTIYAYSSTDSLNNTTNWRIVDSCSTTPVPVITNIRPAAGKRLAIITMNGTGFESAQRSGKIMLNSVSLGKAYTWTSTAIVDTVPVAAEFGSNNGIIINDDYKKDTLIFRVTNPVITIP